jgi:hypothetical protein
MGLVISACPPSCEIRSLTVDNQSIIRVRFEELLRHQTSTPRKAAQASRYLDHSLDPSSYTISYARGTLQGRAYLITFCPASGPPTAFNAVTCGRSI